MMLVNAFHEFCAVVVYRSGKAPESVTLPDAAFDELVRELEPRCVYACAGPGEAVVLYETSVGQVRIRRSTSAPPKGTP